MLEHDKILKNLCYRILWNYLMQHISWGSAEGKVRSDSDMK